MRALVLVVLCALGSAVAAAQDTAIVIQPESAGIMVPPPELPHAVAEEAVRRYNAATTTRLVGRSRLPRGNEWRGDVAVRNGTIVVAGRVDGTLLVINGDAILDSGAVVTGDVFVVGGTVARSPGATVGGDVRPSRTAPRARTSRSPHRTSAAGSGGWGSRSRGARPTRARP